ncbi:phospholipase effector Tle1 domain-containing protein [Marinobacter fonticola]|uniref:phospholipase effector Tle1 domain-containing protein n=1 Tax=Marinobacter fonticola TaxID=2603215 RepID=UPI0011E708BA|nr:DUF2235 domain-containing protein [Marinobacter fonticola]
MSKAIVVCCDGTWNKPEIDAGKGEPSNILKCVRALKAHSGRRDQVVYYDGEVGTAGRTRRWLTGAFGMGLSTNLLQAYRFIANNWAPSDDIYLLGFSRGAYTVRSLAGFIHVMGLMPKSEMKHLPQAYQWYRAEPGNARDTLPQAALMDELRQASRRIPIRFLGVFDTVGALGIPMPGLRRLSRRWVGFHDTQLCDSVSYAVQALAIDERRAPFQPALWTHADNADEHRQDTVSHRTLQVWLPGVHGDVGGGYPSTGLSDLALQFMIAQANQHGLEWQLGGNFRTAPEERISAPLNDSFSWAYRAFGEYRRPIGGIQRNFLGLERSVSEKVHISATDRLKADGLFGNRRNLEEALEEGTPVFHERRHLRLIVPEALAVADMPNVGEVCTLVDMSESGARLRYSGSGVVSEGASLRLRHPRIGDRTARVRWCVGSEVGVEFAA